MIQRKSEFLTIGLLIIAILSGCSKSDKSTSTSEQPATTQKQEVVIQYSEFQRGFMQIVANYAEKYKAAENELQKSKLVNERMSEFKKLKGNPKAITDWYGVIKKMGTNSDGNAYVTLSISPDLITFSTWNNGFSDMSDKTLIQQSSKIYNKLSEMKAGNVVKFSGQLKHPKNITEAGKMTDPDFIFKFTDISKVGDSVNR
jgi:hypothetical protein